MTPKFPVVTFRAKLAEEGFDGYVSPRFDEHQGEYHVPHNYRLAHISGFTGSAEVAIVMRVRAAIVVDGRRQVQVHDEIDRGLFAIEPRRAAEGLAENLQSGGRGTAEWLVDHRKLPTDLCDFELDRVVMTKPKSLMERVRSAAPDRPLRSDLRPFRRRPCGGIADGCVRLNCSPITLAKIVKNGVELAGFRDGHQLDGAALDPLLRLAGGTRRGARRKRHADSRTGSRRARSHLPADGRGLRPIDFALPISAR